MSIAWLSFVCALWLAAAPLNQHCPHHPHHQLPRTAMVEPLMHLRMFGPLPAQIESTANPATAEKVALGRALFYDTLLSKARDVSCNSCHDLAGYGVDGEPVSDGHLGQKGHRNAPTVYNAAGHVAQFWDGRAPNVEEQAKGPVLNPVEMAMPSEAEVVQRLKSAPEYVAAFRRAFPLDKDPVTFDNMARAIGAFERGLVTRSRWDRFLEGDSGALSAAEREGFRAFTATLCQTCHYGTYVGGASFHRAGAIKPWWTDKDQGRYQVTRQDYDRMVFKVPSLRNVAKTAPYFHDGSVVRLEDAVRLMGEHQVGRTVGPAEVQAIVAWLNSLTGEIPAAYIKR
jgi:cytochrome c peroxidase